MKYLNWNVGGLPKHAKTSHQYRVMLKRQAIEEAKRNAARRTAKGKAVTK